MAKTNLTVERLHHLLDYNKDTGIFTRRVYGGGVRAGDRTGSVLNNGYMMIKVDNENHTAHRLAWFYVNGTWPINQIDHIDCNPLNNSIDNLRDVSQFENKQNMRTCKVENKCGFLGVHKRGKKWAAQIQVSGVKIGLGVFETPELAHQAYLEKKRLIHPAGMI